MSHYSASYHSNVRSDIFNLVPSNAGRVLDFGGGYGATGAALKLARDAKFVVVADLVANDVASKVDVAISGDLDNVDFVRSIITQYGPFDTILCLDVFEHLRDPWKIVSELHYGLSQDGVIVASIPNVNNFGLVGPLILRGRFDLTEGGLMDRTHLRWFTRSGAIDLMKCSGLNIDIVEGRVLGKRGILNKLSFRLLERFMVLQYFIRVSRKHSN